LRRRYPPVQPRRTSPEQEVWQNIGAHRLFRIHLIGLLAGLIFQNGGYGTFLNGTDGDISIRWTQRAGDVRAGRVMRLAVSGRGWRARSGAWYRLGRMTTIELPYSPRIIHIRGRLEGAVMLPREKIVA
jgi:hypothetical protein